VLNCHKATRLMSEAHERPLSLGEKVSLKFHTMMCAGCKNFDRQIDFIGRAARTYAARTAETQDDHKTPR